jgi:hypothetical protein
MATTTPNYGWAVPTSTDLVKDGATAIETLGDSIDASMFTALGTKKAGLVLLSTTSFSAVASQALPTDTFTSAYDNYKIILKISATTADSAIYLKMRASGTDSSANYYWGLYGVVVGGSIAVNTGSNVSTGFNIMDTDTGSSAKPTFAEITLFNPKVAEPTSMIGQTSQSNTAGSPSGFNLWGLHTPSTAYDSVDFIPTAGNISGSITVYGINK